MVWLIPWVVACLEAITAAGVLLLNRNPRMYSAVSDFLTRYGQYCVEESRYLWQWASLRFPDRIMAVDKGDFVKRVMDIAETDVYDFLRLQNVGHETARQMIDQLRMNVLSTFVDQVSRGVAPAARPLQPPAWPTLW